MWTSRHPGSPAVSTYDAYTIPVEPGTWDVPAAGATRFSWEYDDGRQRLLDLYQRGKDKQWDATKRIDWDLPVDPSNIMETPDEFVPIYGSRQWEILNAKERENRGRPDRRVRARHGFQVLRRHPDHGRGPARRAVLAVPAREGRPLLPDEQRPGQAAGRLAERLPLGPPLPRHAGPHRGAGAGRVRRAPGHGPERAGQATARLRHAGRGTARRLRPARAARLLP